jgi:hypothetical protein
VSASCSSVISPTSGDADLDVHDGADAGRQHGLERDDGVIDEALGLECPGNQEASAVDQLLQRGALGLLERFASLGFGGLRLARLERQLGEVEG